MRPLSKQEEIEYYKIIEPLQNLHEEMGKSVSAQWMLSDLGVNPAVMLVGINPGGKSLNTDWEPKQKNSALKLLKNNKDAFARLMKRCFSKEIWERNTDTKDFNMVWTNLSPFRTTVETELKQKYALVRKKGIHPRALCRKAMAKLIGLSMPKILLIAGKTAFIDIYAGLKDEYGEDKLLDLKKKEGVYTVTLMLQNEVKIIGFKRRSSVSFWYKSEKEEIVKHTTQILGETCKESTL